MPVPAAGPAYNPAANVHKVAPADVQHQAEAVLGYSSELNKPLSSAWLDARQEIHDFVHYKPTRALELEQHAVPYSFPVGQAAAIHEQVRHSRLHWWHTCCLEFHCFQVMLL